MGMSKSDLEAVLGGMIEAYGIDTLSRLDGGVIGVEEREVHQWWEQYSSSDAARRERVDLQKKAQIRKETAVLKRLQKKYDGVDVDLLLREGDNDEK